MNGQDESNPAGGSVPGPGSGGTPSGSGPGTEDAGYVTESAISRGSVAAEVGVGLYMDSVSLVIPGRNCAATLRACLSAVVPLMSEDQSGPLREIVFVDDGSTDESAAIADEFPVRIVRGQGRGPGAARNLGWRAAEHSLIWFIDADCVADADALEQLLPHLRDADVGGVSGSYGIMNTESLLANLVHEEIIERHLAMPSRVNFAATFNVLYRRSVLEAVGGFNERFLKAQDAELAYRVIDAGYQLAFEPESRVKHFHPARLGRYLRTQRQQGFWRVWLHLSHRGRARGDSYSSWVDHVQPPLAMVIVASGALWMFAQLGPANGRWPVNRWWLVGALWGVPVGLTALLAVAQWPMTLRVLRRNRRLRSVWFAPLSFVRAFWRGAGMVWGVCRWVLARPRGKDTSARSRLE